jgi:hypothetical protein
LSQIPSGARSGIRIMSTELNYLPEEFLWEAVEVFNFPIELVLPNL